MSKIYKRTLSAAGKAEVGHIFTDGYVPVQEFTPTYLNLEGLDEKQRVFLVDWASLTEAQQFLVLEYMAQKFRESEHVIRDNLEKHTNFPIRTKWVIESYDMRFMM